MSKFVTNAIASIGEFGIGVLVILILGFYALAFEVGIGEWLGWRGWWVTALFFVVVFIFRGGLTLTSAMLIGGYGAYAVWQWPLWVVIPVFFPGIAFIVGALMVALGGSIADRVRAH